MSGDTQKPLTPKQRRFVDAYMGEAKGNGVKAAELAGYKGNAATLHTQSTRMLRNASIRAEIDKISSSSPLIATRDERLQILTEMMRDPSLSPKDRQRAIELLGKSCGDYIQRVEVSGPDGSAIKSEARIDISNLDDAALETLIQATKKG